MQNTGFRFHHIHRKRNDNIRPSPKLTVSEARVRIFEKLRDAKVRKASAGGTRETRVCAVYYETHKRLPAIGYRHTF